MFLAAAVKDLVKDHGTEKVVIFLPDLTITDAARLQPPKGREGHPHHMVPRGVHTASWSEDEVYPQGVVEKRVTGQVLLEIKEGIIWDENQCLGGVGIPRLLITVAVPWRVGEETHPLLDSTRNVEEVRNEGGEAEVGIILSTVKSSSHDWNGKVE